MKVTPEEGVCSELHTLPHLPSSLSTKVLLQLWILIPDLAILKQRPATAVAPHWKHRRSRCFAKLSPLDITTG